MTIPKHVERFKQTVSHVQPTSTSAPPQWSIVEGPTQPPLLSITLGQLLRIQALQYPNHECLVVPWTGARWTYTDLDHETDRLARGMMAMGIQKGDRVGIMAGNCEQYISVFFAAARVGAILVVLNNTYTLAELSYALDHSGKSQLSSFQMNEVEFTLNCAILLFRLQNSFYGVSHWNPPGHDLKAVLAKLGPRPKESGTSKTLEEIFILRGVYQNFSTYDDITSRGTSSTAHVVEAREAELQPNDVSNLQFTSGSTGNPKAAMLTHQ